MWTTPTTFGVEVVTVQEQDGLFVTTIHGGQLDGDRFVCAREPRRQHLDAVRLTAWRKVA